MSVQGQQPTRGAPSRACGCPPQPCRHQCWPPACLSCSPQGAQHPAPGTLGKEAGASPYGLGLCDSWDSLIPLCTSVTSRLISSPSCLNFLRDLKHSQHSATPGVYTCVPAWKPSPFLQLVLRTRPRQSLLWTHPDPHTNTLSCHCLQTYPFHSSLCPGSLHGVWHRAGGSKWRMIASKDRLDSDGPGEDSTSRPAGPSSWPPIPNPDPPRLLLMVNSFIKRD